MTGDMFSTRNVLAWAALTVGSFGVDARLAVNGGAALKAAAEAPNAQAMLESLELYRTRVGSTPFTDGLRKADNFQPFAGRGPFSKNDKLITDIVTVSEIRDELSNALNAGPISDAQLQEYRIRLAACGTVQTVCGPVALLNQLSE